MTYVSDAIGGADEAVRLTLGGRDILVAESWDIQESVMAQPAAWAITLGHGGVAQELLALAKPHTPFEFRIGQALQFTGRVDGRFASQSEGGGTSVTIRGRDALAPLHDSHVKAKLSFKDSTYTSLVTRALAQVGLADRKLLASNSANRRTKAGIPIQEIEAPRTVDEIIQTPTGVTVGAVRQELEAKLDETWHSFVRRYLDRAGLFLWATADGNFVLSEPNAKQPPTYLLVRSNVTQEQGANVVAMNFRDDATHRHSECVVYGKGGGRRHGRAKSKGGFTDDEMVELGYEQPIAFRDVNVQSAAEAAFFARRKLAEERRAGWELEYTIAGHTLPSLLGSYGGVSTRAVVVPDTTVHVVDQDLGIDDVFYIESVRKTRGQGTTTTIHLMRTTDLIFGESEHE